MLNQNKKKILILAFLISLFALISAYFIEYILGYQPCNLCLIERIPYISVIIIITICLFFKKFEIPFALKKNKNPNKMGTYTIKHKNKFIQLSGPILQNWYFVIALK